ncbi:DUF3575 domain-containing protein [Aquimarina sp. 2201CG5-10]|uniref:DUF3575 domain-containing protein n=1 Tax=Aquimarina callyspongiae TaxID=3098150 RepID=UPI002AB54CC2|nr:DUF3575 domain-containing protein [Aquimarina sp. 2201CG5-10]MDY8138563.1 DUF3575 domain-containing protein [Aquimarina sp. 2201CG5-10]
MKKVLTAIFFLTTIVVSAQYGDASVEDQLFKINLFTPGIEYEVGLNKNSTLDFRVGTGFAYVKTNNEEDFGVFLTFEGAYRYYYNLEKRLSKNKNITKNSGNYVALTSFLAPGNPIIGDLDTDIDYIGVVGPVWGFQRTYNSNFNIGLELGLGYEFTNEDGNIAPIVGFRLSWVIGK